MADPIHSFTFLHGTRVMTITPKETIEAEARQAALAGKTINESCRWPFHSPEALHFAAVYALALPVREVTHEAV